MTQRRNKRSGVEDRWLTKDGSHSVRFGKGLRWLARFVDDNGTENFGSFRVKAEATAWLDAQVSAVVSGTFVPASAGRETIAERAEIYLAGKAQLKPKSIASIRSLLDSQVLPRWGHLEIRRVDGEEVQLWVSGLSASGLSSSRVRQAFHLLQAILDKAVARKLLPGNPCAAVDLPRLTTAHGHRFLSMHQVQDLAAACGPDGDVVLTLALTGIRWGELVSLRVSSIDQERLRLSIDATTEEVDGILHEGPPKSYKRRKVSVPPEVMPLLIKRSKGKLPAARLFTTGNGAVLRTSNFRRDVYDDAVASVPGMWERLTIHELRHTFASLSARHKVDPNVISRNLGHANLAVTYSIYVGLFDDALDQSGELLGAAFRAAANQPRIPANQLRTSDL